MNIGIDISQSVYEGTGVGRYVREMVKHIVRISPKNTYVLFGSSFRHQDTLRLFCKEIVKINPSVKTVIIPFPPTILDIVWNIFHFFPITWFTGSLDLFWSSDWTQPPLGNAKGITTIHDVSFLRYPESFPKKIIQVQKRRLNRVKKICQTILCDSQATKNDVIHYLNIPEKKLYVVYPGYHT